MKVFYTRKMVFTKPSSGRNYVKTKEKDEIEISRVIPRLRHFWGRNFVLGVYDVITKKWKEVVPHCLCLKVGSWAPLKWRSLASFHPAWMVRSHSKNTFYYAPCQHFGWSGLGLIRSDPFLLVSTLQNCLRLFQWRFSWFKWYVQTLFY